MPRVFTAACAVLCLLALQGVSQATLVTSAPAGPNATVIDFSQFGPGYGFTFGPTQIGGLVGMNVVFTANPGGGGNSGLGSVLGSGSYGLGANGSWGGAQTYSGLDSNTGSMTYTFDTALSSVGGFINYVPNAGFAQAIIEALDINGLVLESYILNISAPISTPGGFNAGAFRGIERLAGDIYGFRVTGAFIVLDNLTFVPTPEPASLALWGIGGGIGLIVARRRAKAKKLAV